MTAKKAPSLGGSKVVEKRKKTGGRVAGTPNKTTKALKDAILGAAAAVGSDGEGKGGTQGYLEILARTERKAFAGLLGKVLPLTITGDKENPLVGVTRIELVPLKKDE